MFQCIPKVLSRVEIRVLCNPIKLFHSNLSKQCFLGLYVHSTHAPGGESKAEETKTQGEKANSLHTRQKQESNQHPALAV